VTITVPLEVKSGLPFLKIVQVTLPHGRTWWTRPTIGLLPTFEFRWQIREEDSHDSPLIMDVTDYLGFTFIDDDLIILGLTMTGDDTLGITESGFYDIVMSDKGPENTWAFQIVKGPLQRTSIISVDIPSTTLVDVVKLLSGAVLASNPDMLTFGTITRDINSAVTSAEVVWPDGTHGTFTALVLSTTFLGAVDSYSITYNTITYTQPTVTRDINGSVITRPAIVES